MSQPTNSGTAAGTSLALKLGVVVVLGLFGAGVALAYAGWKPESIIGVCTGLGTVAITLLVALGKLGNVQERAADRVEQVAQQTNGALREHISTEIRTALSEHLGEPVNSQTTAQAVKQPPRKRYRNDG